jgi:hypothetical protein
MVISGPGGPGAREDGSGGSKSAPVPVEAESDRVAPEGDLLGLRSILSRDAK